MKTWAALLLAAALLGSFFTLPERAAAIDSALSETFGYAVVREGQDGLMMSGDVRDIPLIQKAQKRVTGDFVWVRRGEKTFVIQDSGVVAKITEIWRPIDALDAEMGVLEAEMEIPSAKVEALSEQIEALSEKGRPFEVALDNASDDMEALSRRLEDAHYDLTAVERELRRAEEAERAKLERERRELQAELAKLAKEMEALSQAMETHSQSLELAHQPMEALVREVELESQSMEELSKKMEPLGERIEKLSRQADRETQALIDLAIRDGKAVPAESAPFN